MVSFNLTDWFKETFKEAAKMFIMLDFLQIKRLIQVTSYRQNLGKSATKWPDPNVFYHCLSV